MSTKRRTEGPSYFANKVRGLAAAARAKQTTEQKTESDYRLENVSHNNFQLIEVSTGKVVRDVHDEVLQELLLEKKPWTYANWRNAFLADLEEDGSTILSCEQADEMSENFLRVMPFIGPSERVQ